MGRSVDAWLQLELVRPKPVVSARPTTSISKRLWLISALAGLLVSIVAVVGSVPDAGAQLIDPASQANAPSAGPAAFLPAPNPNPYCDSSFVFPAWPGNAVVPTAPLPPVQEVNAGGVTATMTFTSDGDPEDIYPGSYSGVDQTKGFEFAGGDAATVALSEPLFYSQWVFTDVDKLNEGFILQPSWVTTGPNAAAIIVGEADAHVTFDSANDENRHEFNHPVTEQWQGYQLGGRVQVDYFGAINGLDISRPADGDGQSGFAIAGGCVAAGASKRLASPPVWNGTSFDVTYEIKVRNNLPSTATLRGILDFAEAAATTSAEYGAVQGIPLAATTFTDDLSDPRFSAIDIVSLTNPTGGLSINTAGYDGITDTNLLLGASNIEPDSAESILLGVRYTPDRDTVTWTECVAPVEVENSAEFTGSAGGIAVADMSDDGPNPHPADDNGAGGVDDPTLVLFECPAQLEIVKTVVASGEACPANFAAGIGGDGPALFAEELDTVNYCIAVRNVGLGAAVNVVVSDPLLGFAQNIPLLAAGDEIVFAPQSYVVPVGAPSPLVNAATAVADNTSEVTDRAVVKPDPLRASITIEKTVLAGADADCSTAVDGVDELVSGDPYADVTYCFAVSNNGTVRLLVDEVVDVSLGINVPVPAVDQLLAPGTAVIVSHNATITNDLVNTATVTGVPATETGDPIPDLAEVNDDDTAEVTLDLEPAIRLDKTVLAGADADCSTAVEGTNELVTDIAGTAITYCFTATNTGNTHLLATEIVDTTLDINIDIAETDQLLAPGTSITAAHNDTITTTLTNTATITATPTNQTGQPLPDVADVTDTNTAKVKDPLGPDITLEKTVLAGANADCTTATEGTNELVSGNPDTPITYCFTATNTGGTFLTTTDIVDTTLDLNIAIAETDQLMAPGASITAAHNDTVTTTLTNTATITATPTNRTGQPLPDTNDVTDTNTAEVVLVLTPSIKLDKMVVSGPDAACATAVPGIDELVADVAGTEVSYCFVVTNTGNTHLVVTEVVDTTLDVTIAVDAADQLLSPAESVMVTYNDTIAVSLVNTATVTGRPVDQAGDLILALADVTDSDDAEVNDPLGPNIQLDKTVLAGADANCSRAVEGVDELVSGDPYADVTYCFAITNTGGLYLKVTEVVDVGLGMNVPVAAVDQLIAPGTTVIVSHNATITNNLVNTATVTGIPATETGDPIPDLAEVNDDDTAEVTLDLEPAIRLDKTVLAGADADCTTATEGTNELVSGNPETPITYCFAATNTGNTHLLTTEIADTTLGITIAIAETDQLMAPGASITVAHNETISTTLTNTATITATPTNQTGEPLPGVADVTDTNTAEVIALEADLSTQIRVSDPTPLPGETVTYSIDVANSGPYGADNVILVNSMPTDVSALSLPSNSMWKCLAGASNTIRCARTLALQPGKSDTLTYEALIADSATPTIELISVAEVSATTADPDLTNNRDSVTVTPLSIALLPSIEYPGPFTPIDEVLSQITPPLVLTGSNSIRYLSGALLLIFAGGLLVIGSRRRT